MAEAWSTVVEREPEYDAEEQARIRALDLYEQNVCPNCGSYNTLVPLETERVGRGRLRRLTQFFRWDKTHGVDPARDVEVRQYRCITCAAVEIARRDFQDRHKDHKPSKGQAAPGDGRHFIARPIEEEDT